MSNTIYDPSAIPARKLLERLRHVDRELAHGRVPADALSAYESVAEQHDAFAWAVRHLDTDGKSLDNLAVQGKAFNARLQAREDASDRHIAVGFLAGAAGAFSGVIALGLTFFGGPAVRLAGEVLGVAANALMVGGAAIIGVEAYVGERRMRVANGFDKALTGWGKVLFQEDEAEKREIFPTRMLGLQEKRALAEELARALEAEGA